MACCGGEDENQKEQGVVRERKCRDVLCLLLFIAFWVGMFIICGFAARKGDTNRLVYGVDSFGFTCGSKNAFKGQTFDFKDRKNLYYVNALDLLSVYNIPFAKSVCVSSCPGTSEVCPVDSLPCTNTTQYTCPYYGLAPSSVSGKLVNIDNSSVSWFGDMAGMATTTDAAASDVVTALQNANVGWINNWLTMYNVTASTSVTGKYYQLTSQIPGKGPCYPNWVPTTDYLNRCFPKFPDNFGDAVQPAGVSAAVGNDATGAFKEKFNDISEQWSRYVSSISKGILIIIVAGLAGGLGLSLIWMLILRFFAGFMAWLTIIAVNVALVGITLYSFSYAGFLGSTELGRIEVHVAWEWLQSIEDNLPSVMDPTSVDRSTWKWIAIAAAIVTALVFLLTLLCISRVRIAVACIKVASQAIGAMPLILFFPVIPFIFEVGLVIYWIAITGLLYSAGNVTANCRAANATQPLTFNSLSSYNTSSAASSGSWSSSFSTYQCYGDLATDDMQLACAGDPNCYISYDWDNKLKYAFIYHFFGLLWTNQFLVGFTCVTVAGAVASYYWSRGDSNDMPRMPVLHAMKNTVIYHLGSVAFGAIIIAIIQFIRFLLEYIDRKTKECQEGNCALQWAMCCVKCCMWCLEKIMAFINRNAYIMVAVKGTGYCASAGRAVSLIVSNALRLAVVNVVGDLLLYLGKIAVAATCGIIAFAMCNLSYYNDNDKHPETYIGSPILPIAISVITGYVIAEIFFAVYEMAIDTIMLSFCEDCEVNGGNPRYAPPLLMEVMDGDYRPTSSNTTKPISG